MVAFLAIFTVFNKSLLFDVGLVPTYDFSANDLLVQDAKKWSLLHGNYSKIGFFHPGPIFMQLSALAEWVGFDLLRIFGSPIGALAFGSAILHASALTTFYLSLRDLYESRITALAGMFIMMAVSRVMMGSGEAFFVASWFPYLYTAATLFVLASCVGLATKGWVWLPTGVLGFCMLVHGHASFIGLVPIMASSAAVVLFAAQKYRSFLLQGDLRLTSIPGWALYLSLAIVVWFAFPIIANTILNFPGEVPKYLRFAALPHADSLSGRVYYFGRFFTPALLAIPIIFILPTRWISPRTKFLVLLPLLVGGPATIFYVLRGLDTTDHNYPVYWSTIFFGGAAAMSLIALVCTIKNRTFRLALTVVLVVGAVLSIPVASLKADVSQSGAEVAHALNVIGAAGSEGEYAWIDVDLSDTETVFDIATLSSADKRLPFRRICVTAGNWSAMYPAEIACDLARTPMGIRLQATTRATHTAAEIQYAHTALLPLASSMRIGDSETFSISGSHAIYGQGWSTPEGASRWTDGKEAELFIPSSALPQRFNVHLVFSSLLTPKFPSQSFIFRDAKGSVLGRSDLNSTHPSAAIDLPLDNSISINGLSVIRIAIDSPHRPFDLGIGPDLRELGMLLQELAVRQ